MTSSIRHEIGLMDFLRGWAAIVVFFHHASILGGGPVPIALGVEAVHAFMLVSGFLIFYQVSLSKSYDSLKSQTGITNFYIRRFFRISPLYYVVLIIALACSPYLGEAREAIAHVLPGTATPMDRYFIDDYVMNFLVHITYIFGLFPSYAFSTPLPDWSLGLEMQFYVLFPLMFFFYRKSFLWFFPLSLIGMFGIKVIMGRLGIHFPMPTFLPLSFHNFAAGMLLAYMYLNPGDSNKIRIRNIFLAALTLLALWRGNYSFYMPVLFTLICVFLVWKIPGLQKMKDGLNIIFSHKSSKFLAEISYAVYIIHLIFMLPFFALFLNNPVLSGLGWPLASVLLFIFVAALSYLAYRYIELPGIKLGKNIIHKLASPLPYRI